MQAYRCTINVTHFIILAKLIAFSLRTASSYGADIHHPFSELYESSSETPIQHIQYQNILTQVRICKGFRIWRMCTVFGACVLCNITCAWKYSPVAKIWGSLKLKIIISYYSLSFAATYSSQDSKMGYFREAPNLHTGVMNTQCVVFTFYRVKWYWTYIWEHN